MPGTTSLTVSNELLTAVGMRRIGELRNMKSRPYPILEKILQKHEKVEGGERVLIPWEVDDHSRPTEIVTGYEEADDFAQSTIKPGMDDWWYAVQPAFISGRDGILIRGADKQLDLGKKRMENVEAHFRRVLWAAMIKGPASGTWVGPGPGFSALNPINGADHATGLVEAALSGTNTLHQTLAKGSYPRTTHPQFHNQYTTASGAYGTNGLNNEYLMMTRRRKLGGDIVPSEECGLASEQWCVNHKRVLRPSEQYVSGKSLDDGERTAFMAHGIEFYPEDLPNAGAVTGLANGEWSALTLNLAKGIKLIGQSGYVMKWDPWRDLGGVNAVKFALLHCFGQLVSPWPALQTLEIGGDTY